MGRFVCYGQTHARIERGSGAGVLPLYPWKSTKLQGTLAKLVRIPWKIITLPNHHSMFGHYRHASECHLNVIRWRTEYGPVVEVLGLSLPSPTTKKID